MQFLIDGQNAIHRLGRRLRGFDIDDLRSSLLRAVAQRTPRGAQVLFDGHPRAGEFARTMIGEVEVRRTGDREADDDILDEVRESKCPSHLVVVTDDLELARRAEQLGAQSLRVRDFFVEDETAPEADPDDPPPSKAARGPRTAAGRAILKRVQRHPPSASAPALGGFSPADFGLPETIDLDAPNPWPDAAPPKVRPRSDRRSDGAPGERAPPRDPSLRRSGPEPRPMRRGKIPPN